MPIDFDNDKHYAIGAPELKVTGDNGLAWRWSEIVPAALRSAGLFDTMFDGPSPPADQFVLWLDTSERPGRMKRYDPNTSTWVGVTYLWFISQTAVGAGAQPYDASLESLATLATTAGRFPYTVAPDVYGEAAITAFARSMLDDEDAEAARATLDVDQAKLIYELTVEAGAQGSIIVEIPSQWSIIEIYVNRFGPSADNGVLLMQTGVGTIEAPTWDTNFANTLVAVNSTTLAGGNAALTAIPLIAATASTELGLGHATMQGFNSVGHVGALVRSYSTFAGPATRQYVSGGSLKEIASATTLLHLFLSTGTIANIDLKILGVA